jgi:hypothetical protein
MSSWEGRKLGTPETFVAPLRCVTFLSGNNFKVDEDMSRRVMKVDLFASSTVTRRQLEPGTVELTEEWVTNWANQSQLLSALYALVRENFSPSEGVVLPYMTRRRKASFEKWSSYAPRFVRDLGFADPLEMPVNDDTVGGEEREREATCVACVELHGRDGDEWRPSFVLTLDEIAAAARSCGAFFHTLGSVDDVLRQLDGSKWPQAMLPSYDIHGHITGQGMRKPETPAEREEVGSRWMDRAMATSLGRRMKAAEDVPFYVGGRPWVVKNKTGAKRSSYEFTRRG